MWRAAQRRAFLVLFLDLLAGDQGECDQLAAAQVLVMQVYGSDLTVFVSRIVIDAFICIAAGGVNGDFKPAVFYFAAA